MKQIKIAIVGIGNCASALIQGLYFYRQNNQHDAGGLLSWDMGGYCPSDIVVAAAYDIDRRKVGLDVNQAIFQPPNCTTVFQKDLPRSGVLVKMGTVLDGVPDHMHDFDPQFRFDPAGEPDVTKEAVIEDLNRHGVHVLVNFLPVGSHLATEFYINCALEAGVAVVNCIPVFIASNPQFAERFADKGIPIIGDDVKSQMGATIIHRALTDLFRRRGVKLERTYQLNTGGNTDFLNMLDPKRLSVKKLSKTEAVQSVTAQRLMDTDIHIGPSDYIPWQKDNKVGFIRMEGKIFGNISIDLEMRLSVEDSPNSAGVVVDMIRCARLALDRGQAGVLAGPSALFCKHPPEQFTDDEAFHMVSEFIREHKPKSAAKSICSFPQQKKARTR
jgi:myo-inositol-1-phosphate synthase